MIFARIVTQLPLGMEHRTYTGARHCLRATLRAGGVGALFAGFTLNLVRAFPVSAVILPTSEVVRDFVDRTFPREWG